MRKFIVHCSVLAALLLLSGCGGGSGFSGDGTAVDTDTGTGGGTGTGGTGSTPVAMARIILLADTTQLPSAADQLTEGVGLSAQGLDANGNLLTDRNITFSIPPNSGALVIAASDGSGTQRATLTTGGDPTPRTLTVTATSGTVTAQIDIAVVGTTLTLTGPDTLGYGQTGQYVAVLADSDGDGIGGRNMSFATTAGSVLPAMASSNASTGKASVSLTGTGSGAVSVQAMGLTASHSVTISTDQFSIQAPLAGVEVALGVVQPITVQWLRSGSAAETAGATINVSSSRGIVLPSTVVLDSNGQALASIVATDAGGAVIVASSSQLSRPSASLSVEFVARTASSIDVQASPATLSINESSLVTAVVRDATGNLVKNKMVDFRLIDITGGTLSVPSAQTNSQGSASVIYTASNVSSSDQGVRVEATVRDTPLVADFTQLTVGGRALRITLGTGNDIIEPNTTTYDQPYSVIVTDASGNAVPNAQFRLSVLPVAYSKGSYAAVDVNGDATADAYGVVNSVVCANEDIDHDGVLDAGEDFNGNGRLDPGNAASVPTTVSLNANGAGEFLIRYPQDRANWVKVELRGVATVTGTETTESVQFVLPVLASDVNNLEIPPPGFNSPYGTVLDCASPD